MWSRLASFSIDKSLREWINDGLMAVFFFVVALEIKREIVRGELRDPRTASLPILAALRFSRHTSATVTHPTSWSRLRARTES